MSEEIIKPIELMTDDELFAVLTYKKENYNEEFLNKAKAELEKRNLKLEDIFKRAKFSLNGEEFEDLEINDAEKKLELLKSPVDVIYFENYMKHLLALQFNKSNYIVHFFDNVEVESFFVPLEEIKAILKQFFDIELKIDSFKIEKHWTTFIESHSLKHLEYIANLLSEKKINFVLNSNKLFRFNYVHSPYSIILPLIDTSEANFVFEKIEEETELLYKKLEKAEADNNTSGQLDILEELEILTPEDPALFYNKVQLLDESEKYDEASEALIEALNLELEASNIEDIDDYEKQLEDYLEKVQDKKNIYHALASIDGFRTEIEKAINIYQNILKEDPNDSISHLNLGHLYFSNTEEDDKVKFHFEKYLELEPNSFERESIEEILNNIN